MIRGRSFRGRVIVAVACASGVLLAGHAVLAQIPDKFENLKVLPKDISKQELTQTMRGFSFALGVRCEHCHAKRDEAKMAPGLSDLDFQSDAKAAKGVARKMMRMVSDINGTYLAKLDPKPTLDVQCVTCHRGVPRPETLASLLQRTVADSGVTVATERYRSLREKFYGSGSYDFSEGTLDRVAEHLLQDDQAADALVMLELNAEDHPPSVQLQLLLGEAYIATGDKDKANAALDKALELDPEAPWLKRRVEAMKARLDKSE